MTMLEADRLSLLLRCPRCHGALEDRGAGPTCGSSACGLAGRVFPRVAGQLALVDFERSVVGEEELRAHTGASRVPRGSERGPVGFLRRLSSPPSRPARAPLGDLLARLRGLRERPRVLVVGGGRRSDNAGVFYDDAQMDVIAFDIYASADTHFIADAHGIPLADACIHAVLVEAVLEHVLEPSRVVEEITRVLVPDGLVYAATPFLQHVHEGPWDFTRFTETGHRWLFRGFDRLDSGVVAGPATTWVWATEQLVRGLARSHTAGKLARVALSWVHVLDRLVPEPHASDGASCVYFYGRRSSRSLEPAEIVREYRGAQGCR